MNENSVEWKQPERGEAKSQGKVDVNIKEKKGQQKQG